MVDTKVFLLKTEVAGLRGHKLCITVIISETLTFDCVLGFQKQEQLKGKLSTMLVPQTVARLTLHWKDSMLLILGYIVDH